MSAEEKAQREASEKEVAASGSDAIAALRDEFRKKFDEMAAGNAEVIEAKDREIAGLKQEVTDLRAEVVKSATIPKTETEKPKSEEEIYQDEVKLATELTLNLMKDMN